MHAKFFEQYRNPIFVFTSYNKLDEMLLCDVTFFLKKNAGPSHIMLFFNLFNHPDTLILTGNVQFKL